MLTVLAAVAGVAAILTVVLVVRPTTQVGVGRPTEAPSSAAAPSLAMAASTSVGIDGLGRAIVYRGPPVPAVRLAPVASVAIPTIDGAPIRGRRNAGFVAISPDGRLAYIARRAAGVVTVLDIRSTRSSRRYRYRPGPRSSSRFAGWQPRLCQHLQRRRDHQPRRRDWIPSRPDCWEPSRSIRNLMRLAVTPDQRFVYVPSHDAAHIDIIDIATNTVVQTVPVPPNPHWVTFTPDGKVAYVADHESNVLSVLDTASNTVVQTINVGTSPHSVAVSPDGKQVAVVCFDSNDLYFIDTATNQVEGSVPVRHQPAGCHLRTRRALPVHRECGGGDGFRRGHPDQDRHREHPDRFPDQRRGFCRMAVRPM